MKYDVFISYSRKDTNIADRICKAFDDVGIVYFIDRQGIGGGVEFPDKLADAIINSSAFLLLGSNNSYNSPFTKREVTFAFNKKRGEQMLPYLIDNTPLPSGLELVFSSINWRNIKEHPIETVLVDDILRMLGRTRPAPKAPASKSDMAPITPAKTYKVGDLCDDGVQQRKLRLYQVARGFKVGVSSIVEFLDKKGIKIDRTPNTLIDSQMYALLEKEFGANRGGNPRGDVRERIPQKTSVELTCSSKTYKVGDLYDENGKRGVVFEVSADGKHGKIVSLAEKRLEWANKEFNGWNEHIGAYSKTDGAVNMAVVQRIPNWREK